MKDQYDKEYSRKWIENFLESYRCHLQSKTDDRAISLLVDKIEELDLNEVMPQ